MPASKEALTLQDTAAEEALRAVATVLQLPENTLVQSKIVGGQNRADLILKEAARGYDLIVLGASEGQRSPSTLFNLLVDRVVQESPCATLIVKSHLPIASGESCAIAPQTIRHILVPTIGSETSTNAVEVASAIAAQTQARLTLIHVVSPPQEEYVLYDEQTLDPFMEIAQQIVDYQVGVVANLGANAEFQILDGRSPEREILNFADREQVDLIVLGTNLRLITGRVFFGHRVDAILSQANCPVAVLSSVK